MEHPATQGTQEQSPVYCCYGISKKRKWKSFFTYVSTWTF